jgi:2-polyprenyl-3-methyl-5-hydroxy-6-metoxy-1,4-benzoquinol methylase
VTPADVSCNLCGAVVDASLPARWRKDGFDVVQCPRCALLFRRDLPAGDEVAEIYAEEYFKRPASDAGAQGYLDYLRDEEAHRLSARKRLAWLDRRGVRPPGRLLDVGAAAGFFMDEARRSGWEVEGIDVAPSLSGWARERLGLQVLTGEFQGAMFSGEPFDCLTMWDYIEHSVDPMGDFRHALELLGGSGHLVLSTGDAASPVARLSGKRWHLLTPRHHNFFFTAATLRSGLDRAGFDVLESKHLSSPYSLRYCVYKLGTIMPRSRVLRFASRLTSASRLGRVALPVNLGDIVTVLAKAPGAE